MNTVEKAVLDDLKRNGAQSSWDLPADERFARIIEDTTSEELIHRAVNSASIMIARLAAVESTGITQKRLRVLRKLQKLGYVESYWEGLGAGGRNEFGVGRVRTYALLDERRPAQKEG